MSEYQLHKDELKTVAVAPSFYQNDSLYCKRNDVGIMLTDRERGMTNKAYKSAVHLTILLFSLMNSTCSSILEKIGKTTYLYKMTQGPTVQARSLTQQLLQ